MYLLGTVNARAEGRWRVMEKCLPRPEKCPRDFREQIYYYDGGPNMLSSQTFPFEIENPEPFPGYIEIYKTPRTTLNEPTTQSMTENNMPSGKMFEFRTENSKPHPRYINTTNLDELTTNTMIETTRIPRPTFNHSPVPNKPQIDDYLLLLLGLLINLLPKF